MTGGVMGRTIDTCGEHYSSVFGTTWCYFEEGASKNYGKFEECCKKEGGGLGTKRDTGISQF
jgi:hypothetical protein